MDSYTMATGKNKLRNSISKELGSFIESKSSTFACGGAVSISDGSFAIRWDSTGTAKINFPVDLTNKEHQAALLQLIQDCQPASFGYKGKDVLDDSYRKATKMDRSAFSVDFCPYEVGIIDTIAQILLPNAGGSAGTHGVRAELYKLNIYTAPSGFFKAHVDTPRSTTQFGSLVISLPCHHEGGQLAVRHAGHSTTFDWGTSKIGEGNNSVQWAAFYSDCEHEVLEVTEGHRVTLTYNLYYSPGNGDLAVDPKALDVTSLPLYKKVEQALALPEFMTKGGYLGIGCQHAYAHSTEQGTQELPAILKGSDMAVYSVFKALGLQVVVRPIFDLKNNWYFGLEKQDKYEGEVSRQLHKDLDFVGRNMGGVQTTEIGGEDSGPAEVLSEVDGDWYKIEWLTRPMWKSTGLVHLTYGNEAGINEVYTHAALIVAVPTPAERLGADTSVLGSD